VGKFDGNIWGLSVALDNFKYFNTSPKRRARYKEVHLTDFRSHRDVDVAKAWLDLFMKHRAYYRAVLIDWSIWDGRHFGDAFDPDALKKRRAYKKWAEMLLHGELKNPTAGSIRNAELVSVPVRGGNSGWTFWVEIPVT
jgi:hypothetical protein